MDREQYMKNLQDVLKERFSQRQANDILGDYSEFFDAGIAEGKSESELCTEFGSPERVAQELVSSNSEEQKTQINWPWLKIALVFGITISFFLLTLYNWNIASYGHYFTLLLPLALQAIIWSKPKKASSVACHTSRLCRFRQNWLSGWKLIILSLFLSIVSGCCLVRMNSPIWQPPYWYGHFFIYFPALALIAVISVLCLLYPTGSNKYRYLKLLFIIFYSLIVASALALFIILSKLAQLNPFDRNLFELIGQLYNSMTILCCGIVALSIFTAILVIIYAIHVNSDAKWLLFLSTTCFTIFLNGMYILFNFTNGSTPNLAIFLHSIRNSILLNAMSVALFILFLLIQRKFKAKGEKCYERANEKGDS